MPNLLIEKECPNCNKKMSVKGFLGDIPHTYYLECFPCFISIPVAINEPLTIGSPIKESYYIINLIKGLDIQNPIMSLLINHHLLERTEGNVMNYFCRNFIVEGLSSFYSGEKDDSYCFELKEVRGSLNKLLQPTHFMSFEKVECLWERITLMRQNGDDFAFINYSECSDKIYEYKRKMGIEEIKQE